MSLSSTPVSTVTCWCGQPAIYRVPVDPQVTNPDTTMSSGEPGLSVCDAHVDRDGFEPILAIAQGARVRAALPTVEELAEYSEEDLLAFSETLSSAVWASRQNRVKTERAEAERLLKEKLASSPKARFAAAVKRVRKEGGVKWHTNIRQCCRGCVSYEQMGLTGDEDTTPYAWTYGGQGHALRWDDAGQPQPFPSANSRMWRSNQEPRQDVYVYHGNGSAPAVVRAFEAEGFTVEWDGSDGSAVRIVLV